MNDANPVISQILREFKKQADAKAEETNLQILGGDSSNDAAWQAVLDSLTAAAQYSLQAITDVLLDWRKTGLAVFNQQDAADFQNPRVNAMVLRKRLAIEAIFLEAALAVLKHGCSQLSERQGSRLEGHAFDWILNSERYIEPRLLEFSKCCSKVLDMCSQILGALSPQRLATITAKFLKELCEAMAPGKVSRLKSDLPTPRQEILHLCRGMRHVKLSLRTSTEIHSSIDVLRRLSPLQHTAAVRKSQVQHALAEMVTSILAHSVAKDEPRSLPRGQLDLVVLEAWYQAVTTLRSNIASWAAKASKHAAVAIPLQAQLLCLSKDEVFEKEVNGLIDNLQKQLRGEYTGLLAALNPLGETEKKALKDRWVRTSAVKCLGQCVSTYLRRFAKVKTVDHLEKWLKRTLAGVLGQLRKGSFPLMEQQVLIRQLLVNVSRYAPEYTIRMLADPMLTEPTNLEMVTVGLESLIAVILSPYKVDPAKGEEAGREMGEAAQEAAAGRLVDIMRGGGNPLLVHSAVQYQGELSLQLGKFMKLCKSVFSGSTLVASARTLAEVSAKERLAGLPAPCTAALRCVPFVLPRQWVESPALMAEELAMYTIHVEPSVHEAALAAIKRSMCALPAVRSALLTGLASTYATLPDDNAEVVYKVASVLVEVMGVWRRMLEDEQPWKAQQPHDARGPALDLPRVEGYALSILCSNSVQVRQAGIKVLFSVRALHRALQEGAALTACQDSSTSSTSFTGASPRSVLGGGEAAAYLADLVDQLGDDCAHSCYWQTNYWSSLRQLARPVPSVDTSFQEVMTATGRGRDAVRWTRTLAELTRAAASGPCPFACTRAAEYICSRLQAILVRDLAAGRAVLPGEHMFDVAQLSLGRCFAAVVMASPRYKGSQSNSFSTRDVVRLLFATIRSCGETQQAAAVMALGCCHRDNYALIPEELHSLNKDFTADRKTVKTRLRQGEVKVAVAHVLRMVLEGMQPGLLRTEGGLRSSVLDCISDARRHLAASPQEVTVEMQQLRCCLAALCTRASQELGLAAHMDFPSPLRRQLFELLSEWSVDSTQAVRPGTYRAEVQRGFPGAVGRVREAEQQRAVEADLAATVAIVEHCAQTAMAALMLGPVFEKEARTLQGKPLAWVHQLLAQRGDPSQVGPLGVDPQRMTVAVTALSNLLRSSAAELTGLFIDQCYAASGAIAHAYFQAVLEVYATVNIPIRAHVLLALVLYKAVDQVQSVRESAVHLLRLLAERVWQEGAASHTAAHHGTLQPNGTAWGLIHHANNGSLLAEGATSPPAALVGALQESCHAFQLDLSTTLAREHPELTELLCVEVMARQLQPYAAVHQHAVLAALAPWMKNLSFAARWEGNWSERLLKAMYLVTQRHAAAFPEQVETLWRNVAMNKRNIVPVLDFLVAHGYADSNAHHGQAVDVQLTVPKRIVLYLARESPADAPEEINQTIDHLVAEAARLINEVESEAAPMGVAHALHLPTPSATSAAPSPPNREKVLEFSDEASWPAPEVDEAPWPEAPSLLTTTSRRGSNSISISRASSNLSARHQIGSVPSGIPSVSTGLDRESAGPMGTPGAATPDVSLRAALVREGSPFSNAPLGEPDTPASVPRTPGGHVAGAEGEVRHVSRPEVAAALLAEALLEHQQAARRHAPLLAHLALVTGDSPVTAPVPGLAAMLLAHLIAALSMPHLQLQRASGGMLAEYEAAAGLLAQLKEMAPHPLWPRQAPTPAHPRPTSAAVLAVVVQSLLAALCFEQDLRERWAAHALFWALSAPSRHSASRSHQVFRALGTPLTQEACARLLQHLHSCLSEFNASTQIAATDTLLTLTDAVDVTPRAQLVLYPQLYLAALVALDLPYVHLHAAALTLFAKMVGRMEGTDPAVRTVVAACGAASAPALGPAAHGPSPLQRSGPAGRPWPLGAAVLAARPEGAPLAAVQQLLAKGLYHSSTHQLTLQVLSQLMRGIATEAAASTAAALLAAGPLCLQQLAAAPTTAVPQAGGLLGEPLVQVAVSLLSSLPFLLPSLTDPAATACLAAHGVAAAALELPHLAAALEDVAARPSASSEAAAASLARPLADALFPRFAKAALQRMMEALQRGQPPVQAAALALLHAVFAVPGVRMGAPASLTAQLMAPLPPLLSGPHSRLAQQAIEAMMRYCSAPARAPRASPADAAHLSPSRGDTLPAAAARPQVQALPIDWPSACGAAPQGAVDAVASLAATWSLEAQAGPPAGGLPSVPSVYRLPGAADGAISDSDSTAG